MVIRPIVVKIVLPKAKNENHPHLFPSWAFVSSQCFLMFSATDYLNRAFLHSQNTDRTTSTSLGFTRSSHKSVEWNHITLNDSRPSSFTPHLTIPSIVNRHPPPPNLNQELIPLSLTNNTFFHPAHWLICSVYCKGCFQPWWEWSEPSRQATFLLQRERTGGLYWTPIV